MIGCELELALVLGTFTAGTLLGGLMEYLYCALIHTLGGGQ
jgi:hypothetical protein